jgi:hypothetical protein
MMKNRQMNFRSPIRHVNAEGYILTSLVGFAATVIVTRTFLELTGYPQIGNNVLHIAHALWGGLLLIVAAYLPLMYANRWALQTSAVTGGIGIGLFIDEVGKFITQANDYFFPPALSIIYSFILINVLVYFFFRRTPREDPRAAVHHALEGMKALVDGDLNEVEGEQIAAQLAIAKTSDQSEIATLAYMLEDILENDKGKISTVKPNLWNRWALKFNKVLIRLGRKRHRTIISIFLLGWVALVIGYIAIILKGGDQLDPQVLEWRGLLIGIQFVVGVVMAIAVFFWLKRNEELGLKLGTIGLLISMVALQLLYFYLSQFSAITSTLIQLAILQLLFFYRRLYLDEGQRK